jgi:hypothetical protein
MQMLAILFFFSVLALAVGSMRLLLTDYADKIGAALAGQPKAIDYGVAGNIVPFRPAVHPSLTHGLRAAA